MAAENPVKAEKTDGLPAGPKVSFLSRFSLPPFRKIRVFFPPLLATLIFFAFPCLLEAQNGAGSSLPYPEIRSLLPQDGFLRQLQEDIAFFHIQERAGRPLPPAGIYLYRAKKGDDFFSLSSRFNLPYEALATLNRLSSPSALSEGKLLLVPNMPGLFLPLEPRSELEQFIQTWRRPAETQGITLVLDTPEGRQSFLFLPGERFHSIERAFFLGILFHNPLPPSRITSWFGNRVSPISGEVHFHSGIDMAAPEGTPVSAAREGTVSAAGADPVYGIYVRIAHVGGYETFYGHLKRSFVQLNQRVTSTMIIGEVGDTGLSTGPHLHFELRKNQEALDPESFLPGVER